ncbi:MAG: hypothetical protein LUG27_00435 [Clostridiales bacterium]|nr:hypothetical protein [Clostridiales bacterium]
MRSRNLEGMSGCLDWGDPINDGNRSMYNLLDEGDYPFTVTEMRRGRTSGTGKLPPCNRAELTLCVEPEPGKTVNVKCDLILHTSVEWRLAAFFRCIGAKRKGEQTDMDWQAVKGARGYGHFKPKAFTGRDGKEHKVNECTKFYDYDERNFKQDEPTNTAEEDFLTVDEGEELPF